MEEVVEQASNELATLPRVLTVPEMARILRIGRGAAYDLVRSGSVPVIRVGRLMRIPRDGLLAWMANEKPPVNGPTA